MGAKKHWTDNKEVVIKFEIFEKDEYEWLKSFAESQNNDMEMQIESIVQAFIQCTQDINQKSF